MYRAYWTGRGSSRLYWASTCARCSGVSFWAFRIGVPGRNCIRNQVAVATMNSTTRAFARRLSVYLSIPTPYTGVPREIGESALRVATESLAKILSPISCGLLLSLYLHILPVGATEGVVRVVLEIGLLKAGQRLEVQRDSRSLFDQDLLRLQHVLHAKLQVRGGLGFLDEPVIFLVVERRVVVRGVRKVEVHEGHRVIVVADPAVGEADLVVLRHYLVQRGVEGHDLHVDVDPEVLFVLVLKVGRDVPARAAVIHEHRQLGLIASQLLDPLLPELPRGLYVLGHEISVGLPEGLVTGAWVDRRRDEAVSGQRAILENIIGETLPVETDHQRLADVEVGQLRHLLVQPSILGGGQRKL